MRIAILLLLMLFSVSSKGQIEEKDILGSWQAGDSATYNFSATGGQLVLTVVSKQGSEEDWNTFLFAGVFSDNALTLCALSSVSTFDACYTGEVASRGLISLLLGSCSDRILNVCGALPTAILLEREIIFDASGIYFAEATGEYFLVNGRDGLADVVQVNITDSRGDNFVGTKPGNSGNLVPVDDQGRTISFVVNSDTSITATISGCLNITQEICDQIPPGTSFELTKI
jgi:hypothetical protein